MVPFSYFQSGELERLIADVNGYRKVQKYVQQEEKEYKEYYKFKEKGFLPFMKVDVSCMEEEDFQELWGLGHPIVMTGCLPRFQIPWTPPNFMEKYGQNRCILVDCNSDKTITTTVGKFFGEFTSDEPKRPLKLKVFRPFSTYKFNDIGLATSR
jgi:hypothetical protein